MSCEPASGTSFPLGTTTVACTATDSSGNVAQTTFQVTVLAPLDIEISFDRHLSVNPKTGVATVHGTVTCNRTTTIFIIPGAS